MQARFGWATSGKAGSAHDEQILEYMDRVVNALWDVRHVRKTPEEQKRLRDAAIKRKEERLVAERLQDEQDLSDEDTNMDQDNWCDRI